MAYRFNSSSLSRTTNLPNAFNFTMMGWFRLAATPAANSAFFSFGNVSGAYIELYTNTSLNFRVFSSGSASAPFNLTVGRWYHMALVCRGSSAGQMEGWLDGRLVVTGNPSASTLSEKLFIGNTNDGENVNAYGEAFKIFNRALNGDEIAVEMQCVVPLNVANCVSWHAGDPGSHLIDSATGNNWTAAGTINWEESSPPIPFSQYLFPMMEGGGAVNLLSLAGAITTSGAPTKKTSTAKVGAITPSSGLIKAIYRALSGSVSSSGIAIRMTGKSVAGTAITGGVPIRRTGKAIAGAVSPTATILKSTSKLLSGVVTTGGAILRQFGRSVLGAITPSGSLVRMAGKSVAGTVTTSASPIKTILKALSGSVSSSGAVSLVRTFIKLLAGAVTATGTVTRSTYRALQGSATTGGQVIKLLARSLGGSIAPSGTAVALKTFLRSLSGSIAASGTVVRQTWRNLAATITASGVLSRTISFARSLSGAISTGGTVIKQTYRVATRLNRIIGNSLGYSCLCEAIERLNRY